MSEPKPDQGRGQNGAKDSSASFYNQRGEFHRRREERGRNGVKNLNRSEVIPDVSLSNPYNMEENQYYLEKIVGEGRVLLAILKFFFLFFLDHLFYFDVNLDQKANDKAFLERMIASLQEDVIQVIYLKFPTEKAYSVAFDVLGRLVEIAKQRGVASNDFI